MQHVDNKGILPIMQPECLTQYMINRSHELLTRFTKTQTCMNQVFSLSSFWFLICICARNNRRDLSLRLGSLGCWVLSYFSQNMNNSPVKTPTKHKSLL